MITGYHTQEFRCDEEDLESPIICNAANAWLGKGYYFWVEEEYAKYWGEDYKIFYPKDPGYYSIYKANLKNDKFLDTVFNEEGYNFFIDSINEAYIELRKRKNSITLLNVNRFLADNVWNRLGITGIVYDDKPVNKEEKGRNSSMIPPLYYRKRIQIVCFDIKLINNFALHLERQSKSKS
ncbi:hypothetical protein [Chryseobacterium indologenes]|uniref:hypothetical protein n=1 Tax=Chryseobacterium indologenes TaxID=253 RepID=UPI003D346F4C